MNPSPAQKQPEANAPAFDSRVLARLCGVSRGTVDRALHGRGEVSAKTREKILRMAREHGYRPNALGRALVTGRTRTLGLVVFDLENSFFTELVSGFEARARERGYLMLLALSHKTQALERECLDHFESLRVDALALFPLGMGKAYESALAPARRPVLAMGNRLSKGFPFIGIDEHVAMNALVDECALRRYRQAVYYTPPLRHLPADGKTALNLDAQIRRHEAFLSATRRMKIRSAVVIERQELEARLSHERGGRTVFLCSNDLYAMEILESSRGMGLAPPRDFGLVGFDGLSLLRWVQPSLATLAYPTREAGATAVDSLLDLLEGRRAGDRILPHRFIAGETLAPFERLSTAQGKKRHPNRLH